MVELVVYAALGAAVFVSFWVSLVEATFLTLHPLALNSSISDGSSKAKHALEIVNDKTRLISVTTMLDTISNVVLASSVGLIFSETFGPIGWVYSVVIGSLMIMILLSLLPKAIGIENSLRMALFLAPSSKILMDGFAPVAVPLTSLARVLSQAIVGKPGYKEVDLVDEFEDVVTMLEKAGHIEPDAGRLLRSALTSSKSSALDAITPTEQIVWVSSGGTVLDALKLMGRTNHPRMPVFDEKKGTYIGAVTFRTVSKAIDRDHFNESIMDYMTQPARVAKDDGLASVMEKLQDAGTTIAFVYDDDRMIGMITLSDIIERVLGVKV